MANENNLLKSQINKISNEKSTLINNQNVLMKSMELIENEKTEIKRNNSNYILKYNNMEKEIKFLN